MSQAHAADEDGSTDPRHHKTGDGGDVRQQVEQDEFPDVRVILDPLADRTDLPGRLRCIVISHCSAPLQCACLRIGCGRSRR